MNQKATYIAAKSDDARKLGHRIKMARRLSGMDQKHFGMLFGVSASAVSQWESGDTVPGNRLRDIAEALLVPIDWLFSDAPYPAQPAPEGELVDLVERGLVKGDPVVNPNLKERPNIFQSLLRGIRNDAGTTGALLGERDLPVYGTARGGAEGTIGVGPDPIEFVKRPEPLLRVPGGFGVVLYGDSMEPVFRHGDILLIHPSKPPAREDDALLVKADAHGAREAIVKRLINWTERVWKVRQFNPKRDYDLSRTEWTQAMKIVGMYRR